MSTLGFAQGPMASGSESWRALAELMTDSSHELSAQSTAGLPPSVQGAAATFLSAWSGHAAQSSTLASGFADALRAAAAGFWATDQSVGSRLTDLDGRLRSSR